MKDNIQDAQKITSVDYGELINKFSAVVDALGDPEVSGKQKNDLLKGIVKRIEYDRAEDGSLILDIFVS